MLRSELRNNLKNIGIAERDKQGTLHRWGIYETSYIRDTNPADTSMQEIIDLLNFVLYILYKNKMIK